MAAGKQGSKIIAAIQMAEFETTGKIQVHLSKSLWENDPFLKAQKLFYSHHLDKAQFRNGVLLYLNLRKKRFAIYGDEGIHHIIGQSFWEKLGWELKNSLQSTSSDAAIADAVTKVGAVLKEHFAFMPNNE